MTGYVRIHRALLDHPVFRNDAEAMAFAWMVARAQWKPKTIRYKGFDVPLERGELTASIRDIAGAMDRPKGWVERLLAKLRKAGMVKIENRTPPRTPCGTPRRTPAQVLIVCNYDDYQAPAGAGGTLDETGTGQRQDTEQLKEEGKEGSEANASSPWARPLGIEKQVWNDLLINRKRKNLPNTQSAWKRFNDDLARISVETGIPPPKLIERCTERGWGAIYDPRESRNDRQTGLGKTTAALAGLGSWDDDSPM